jgi:hypothetical protein
MSKPSTSAVMRDIIRQIREAFPFHFGEQELCTDTCSSGCPLKLLEYMEMEIQQWEERLDQGEIPTFGDIQKMGRLGQKIHRVLQKNQLTSAPGK